MKNFYIERICSDTIEGAAELEKLCFSSPWSVESLALLCKDGAVGFVARDEQSGDVLAYGGMLTVLDEGQVTNIATHPNSRRQGLGYAVTKSLIDHCRENGIVTLSLEVRESNLAAISMYEKLGFFKVGIRKNFYRLPTENAIVMIKNI